MLVDTSMVPCSDGLRSTRVWAVVIGDPAPEMDDGLLELIPVDTAVPGWDVSLVDING